MHIHVHVHVLRAFAASSALTWACAWAWECLAGAAHGLEGGKHKGGKGAGEHEHKGKKTDKLDAGAL